MIKFDWTDEQLHKLDSIQRKTLNCLNCLNHTVLIIMGVSCGITAWRKGVTGTYPVFV